MRRQHEALRGFFEPRSVALVGASAKAGSLGATVMRNLLRAEFSGIVLPVNPKYRSVFGVWCHHSVADLPAAPDLAVLCTPPATLVGLIERLAAQGTRAALVMTADPDGRPHLNTPLKTQLLEAARRTGMRLLGPGSTGIQVTRIGLNASWITTQARAGKLALVSQSAAMTAGVVDWATAHGVGFSHIVSAGDAADVDLGDVLDHLASDGRARAVLLLLKQVGEARSFLSAARAIARIKPVVTMVAGRRGEPTALLFPNGELVGGVSSDAVYDAAIRRAGMLRVYDTDELFAAVETLASARRPSGNRVAIVGNGSGPGEFSADVIVEGGGRLATLAPQTLAGLGSLGGTGGGPLVDLGRDADAGRLRQVAATVLADPGVDALLAVHVPTATAPATAWAEALAEVAAGHRARNVLACFLGTELDGRSRARLSAASVPVFTTPEKAARAFLHLVNYRRNQDMLVQVPASVAVCGAAERQAARDIIAAALAQGRHWLDEAEAFAILRTYGIPLLRLRVVDGAAEAVEAARDIGLPVMLRLSMRGHVRQYPRDDVLADLTDLDSVYAAAQRVLAANPDPAFDGRPHRLVVQQVPRWSGVVGLAAGLSSHPPFGHVLHVRGAKGSNVVALPPLNSVLADELLVRSGLADMLDTPIVSPRADLSALATLLVRLSELAADLPAIRALAIDPLFCDASGALAGDARVMVEPVGEGDSHLAIRPYPRDLVRHAALADGRALLLRPVRPEDEPGYRDMLAKLAEKDIYLRFSQNFGGKISLVPLATLVHIDYDRQMTFVAVVDAEIVGAVELTYVPVTDEAEFSVVVRSDLKGQGLGRLLTEAIIAYARDQGFGAICGVILRENQGMLALARKLGFQAVGEPDDEDDSVKLVLTTKGDR